VVLINSKYLKYILKNLFTDRMRMLDCLSGDVSLYGSINCNLVILGKLQRSQVHYWSVGSPSNDRNAAIDQSM